MKITLNGDDSRGDFVPPDTGEMKTTAEGHNQKPKVTNEEDSRGDFVPPDTGVNYEVKNFKDLERQVDIHVSLEEVRKAFDKNYKKMQKQAHIHGYRKGKAPMSYIRQHYQEKVKQESLLDLIQEFYPKAIKTTGLSPAFQPEMQFKSPIEENKAWTFYFTVEIQPEVDVDKNFTPSLSPPPPIKVEEKEIEESMKRWQHIANVKKVTVNLANVDKTETDKTETDKTETDKTEADKTIDDNFAKICGYKSLKDMKMFIRLAHENKKRQKQQEKMEDEILTQLTKKYPLPLLPEKIVDKQKQLLKSEVIEIMKQNGIKEEDIKKAIQKEHLVFEKEARFAVHSHYLLTDLIKKLDFTVSPREIQLYMKQNNINQIKDEDIYQNLKRSLLKAKTINHLIKKALPEIKK